MGANSYTPSRAEATDGPRGRVCGGGIVLGLGLGASRTGLAPRMTLWHIGPLRHHKALSRPDQSAGYALVGWHFKWRLPRMPRALKTQGVNAAEQFAFADD
jgi:hypothetical protein